MIGMYYRHKNENRMIISEPLLKNGETFSIVVQILDTYECVRVSLASIEKVFVDYDQLAAHYEPKAYRAQG